MFDGKFIPIENTLEESIKFYKKTTQFHSSFSTEALLELNETETDINNQYDCPVILLTHHKATYHRRATFRAAILNPNLSLYLFFNVMDSDRAFVEISTFISREKNVENHQSNQNKIIANGFDLTHSFRNTK